MCPRRRDRGRGGGIAPCAGWVPARAGRGLRDSLPVVPRGPEPRLPAVATVLKPVEREDIPPPDASCPLLVASGADTLLAGRDARPVVLRLRYPRGGPARRDRVGRVSPALRARRLADGGDARVARGRAGRLGDAAARGRAAGGPRRRRGAVRAGAPCDRRAPPLAARAPGGAGGGAGGRGGRRHPRGADGLRAAPAPEPPGPDPAPGPAVPAAGPGAGPAPAPGPRR